MNEKYNNHVTAIAIILPIIVVVALSFVLFPHTDTRSFTEKMDELTTWCIERGYGGNNYDLNDGYGCSKIENDTYIIRNVIINNGKFYWEVKE